jgi:hypothetical protein
MAECARAPFWCLTPEFSGTLGPINTSIREKPLVLYRSIKPKTNKTACFLNPTKNLGTRLIIYNIGIGG